MTRSSNHHHIDGLVAMARAQREPERPKSTARLWIELLLIAAGVAALVGGSICLIIESVVEVQQAQAFKG